MTRTINKKLGEHDEHFNVSTLPTTGWSGNLRVGIPVYQQYVFVEL